MGTSFIEYRGFGFWSRDSFISDWLEVLLEELKATKASPPWQVSMTEHWQEQRAIDGGMMSLDLDDFLNHDDNRQIIVSASRRALDSAGPEVHRTGELFIDLLEGKLKTTISSPINYLK